MRQGVPWWSSGWDSRFHCCGLVSMSDQGIELCKLCGLAKKRTMRQNFFLVVMKKSGGKLAYSKYLFSELVTKTGIMCNRSKDDHGGGLQRCTG